MAPSERQQLNTTAAVLGLSVIHLVFDCCSLRAAQSVQGTGFCDGCSIILHFHLPCRPCMATNRQVAQGEPMARNVACYPDLQM